VLSKNTLNVFELNDKPMVASCSTLSEVVQHLNQDREEMAHELIASVPPVGYRLEPPVPQKNTFSANPELPFGQVPQDSFLHGTMSRPDAEQLLRDVGFADGTFLIRTKGATFVLTMCKDSQFEHHVLSKNGVGTFELNSKPLAAVCGTLSAVVHHLTNDREEMATELTTPVPPPGYEVQPPIPTKTSHPTATARAGGEISEGSFLHGALSRLDAEQLLRDAGLADGTFLIRTKGATFVLTMCKDSQFEHHVLSKNGAGTFELNSQPLKSSCSTLSQVVAHLSADREEIATNLVSPVAPDEGDSF
jgi:hypothetical protein